MKNPWLETEPQIFDDNKIIVASDDWKCIWNDIWHDATKTTFRYNDGNPAIRRDGKCVSAITDFGKC